MNLVAFEFLACQTGISDMDQAGVLVLSEYTGAANSLGACAIRVNPVRGALRCVRLAVLSVLYVLLICVAFLYTVHTVICDWPE